MPHFGGHNRRCLKSSRKCVLACFVCWCVNTDISAYARRLWRAGGMGFRGAFDFENAALTHVVHQSVTSMQKSRRTHDLFTSFPKWIDLNRANFVFTCNLNEFNIRIRSERDPSDIDSGRELDRCGLYQRRIGHLGADKHRAAFT